MKNKFLLMLLTPIALSFVTACNGTSGMKLTYGTYITSEDSDNSDAKEILYSDLQAKMDTSSILSNENFILVVTPTNGCSCWNIFKPILKEFINNCHYLVYQMKVTDFGSNNTYGVALKQGYVGLSLIKKGKVIKTYGDCSHTFSNSTSLKSELDKYVRAPELYYVDQQYLDLAIKNGETLLVDYIRNECGDCNYAIPDALIPYAEINTFNTKMYLFDLQDMYDAAKESTDAANDYQEFKDTHYLSTKFSEEFGYGNGVVPTIHYYERGKLMDANVYFNDSISLVDGQYVVSSSYYTPIRQDSLSYTSKVKKPILQGLKLSENEVGVYSYQGNDYYYWKSENASKYHKPLFEAFMNTYSK